MRREYNGAVPKAQIAVTLGGTTADLTIICDDLTGWPTGVHPFFIIVNRGKATEEKILVASRSGNVLTVWSSGGSYGRAMDDTAIATHVMGEYVEHVFTATDADEANEHVNAVADVHGVAGNLLDILNTKAVYPSQTGHAGEFLSTDGTVVSWAESSSSPPGGTTGQILSKASNTNYDTDWVNPEDLVSTIVYSPTAPVAPADGTVWVDKDAVLASGSGLPDQTGHAGQFLTTDGTSPSWANSSSAGSTLYLAENFF